jgi:hypothetical protein
MNRRSLLALIGFAPVVGVAAALPRADNPNAMLKKVIDEADLPIRPINEPFIFEGDVLHLNEVRCGHVSLDDEVYREMREDLEYKIKWMSESVEFSKREIERLNQFTK